MAVKLERSGPVAWVTIDRPEKRNAVDPATHEELAATWPVLEQDPDIRVMVLTGAGDRSFCAGADVGSFLPYLVEAIDAGRDPEHFCGVTRKPPGKPLIAAINGDAFGGGLELALAADLRIASDHARFALPEVRIGAMAGAGGVTRLRRMIPAALAEHMILTGEPITAPRAFDVGLVSEIVPHDQLNTRVSDIAERIAASPQQAIAACRNLRADDALPLDEAMANERSAFRTLMQSEELRNSLLRFRQDSTRIFGQSKGDRT